MTAALLAAGPAALGLVVRATLLIGAAGAAAFLLRKSGASAATRHVAWLLGIAALLALPLFWWLAPPLPLPILRAETTVAAAATLPPPAGAAADIASGARGWGGALLDVWLLGVAAMLLRFAFCRHMVSLLWGEAEPARDPAWQDLLAAVSREMRLSRPVELRLARGPAMPMTWGTLAPRVLLPAEACAWSPGRRRLVLLHELAHVARRDSLSRSAASLACALYWFHPGAWFAARQLRMEQEHAADDRVLKAGAGARTYASSLFDLARRVGERVWPEHAAAMAGMCQLERRLVSITAPAHREPPRPFFLYAAAAIAAAVTLTVATGLPVRRSLALPDPPGMEPVPLATPSPPAPAESGSEPEAQAPPRADLAPPGERSPRELSDGFEASRAPAQHVPEEGRGLEAGQGQIEPAAQRDENGSLPGAPAGLHAQAPAQPRAVYGPPRPQPLTEEQASDPRIPAALRRDNEGRRANAGAGGERGIRPFPVQLREGGGLRISPGLILRPGQAWP